MSGELRDRVQNWIRNWFAHRGKLGKAAGSIVGGSIVDVNYEVDYFEAGWLTSMEVVEFITEIENEFGVQFSDRDLHDPRFVTIAGLTELILECSTQRSEAR